MSADAASRPFRRSKGEWTIGDLILPVDIRHEQLLPSGLLDIASKTCGHTFDICFHLDINRAVVQAVTVVQWVGI
jgi:hypothetical protein